MLRQVAVLVLTVRMEAASSETRKCHMCKTAEGYCPHGPPYLWLKVCSPTEAEANTIALQKLEVWPRHKAKMLEMPEPMTWKKGKIKHHSTFSARKKATPATNKLFPFPMARVSVHQVLLFFFPNVLLCQRSVQRDVMLQSRGYTVFSPSISISVHPCIAASSVSKGSLGMTRDRL